MVNNNDKDDAFLNSLKWPDKQKKSKKQKQLNNRKKV